LVTSRVGVGSTFTMMIARQFVENGEQAKVPLAVPTTN
jgi:hypothetical protein